MPPHKASKLRSLGRAEGGWGAGSPGFYSQLREMWDLLGYSSETWGLGYLGSPPSSGEQGWRLGAQTPGFSPELWTRWGTGGLDTWVLSPALEGRVIWV